MADPNRYDMRSVMSQINEYDDDIRVKAANSDSTLKYDAYETVTAIFLSRRRSEPNHRQPEDQREVTASAAVGSALRPHVGSMDMLLLGVHGRKPRINNTLVNAIVLISLRRGSLDVTYVGERRPSSMLSGRNPSHAR